MRHLSPLETEVQLSALERHPVSLGEAPDDASDDANVPPRSTVVDMCSGEAFVPEKAEKHCRTTLL